MGANTILLTGANGFVAGHILDALLEAGYSVLGTVRSSAAAERVKNAYARWAVSPSCTCGK